MRPPSPLPPGLNDTAFSTAEAKRLGVSRQRMRSTSLFAPFRGVRTSAQPTTLSERAAAYATRMPSAQFFSHLTAAALLGLRLPEGFRRGELHVSSTPPARAPRGRGIIGHQFSALEPPVLVSGLRISSPIDTWLSLGSALTVDDLTVMADGLVSRVSPVTDVTGLEIGVARAKGRRGHQRLAAALAQVRPNTDSARETLLRLVLVRAGFPEPEVNGVIRNSYGLPIAHGDLVYRRYRTVVEYDGGHHRDNERQFNIDIDRLDQLMEERWRVIRVNKDLMYRRATLLGKVDTALRSAGWRPP